MFSQCLPQRVYRTGIMRLDAALGAAHRHSGPRNVESLERAQHERLSLPRWQCVHRQLQAVHCLAVLQLLIRRPADWVRCRGDSIVFVAVIAAGAWLIQRWRIQRLKELHRVRSRIAADLHDEMGLSLARVAILADVAGRSNGDTATADTLKEIGGTARDLVDAASDMAWALDPRHDTVAALVARLRRTAGDVAEGFGATFKLVADPLDGVPMGSEARRHLFLILKEAVRNACLHGHPDNVTLRIQRYPSQLAITLEDDGKGFDPETPRDGQGLASMERRAAEMGAELVIDSTPGHGSTIHLDIPFTSRA